ncbi:hypothetical protein ACHQM5_010651 [Ranunculus cassubicifolius]
MFYSSCIISRTGPLKSIWIAAFCHNKLKKSQINDTNISSSVDEIIQHEATVTYRVLGYLLLGVVRIYSKKVEYLYHDSNLVLTQMNTWVPLKKPMEDMCAPYSLITLPQRFELDTFVLDFPEDDNSVHVASHQLITLEDRPEDLGNEHYSLGKYHYYHEEELTRFEISIDACTPVRDILSPPAMDKFMDVDTSHEPTRAEESMEKLQSIRLSGEELLDFNISPGANESMDVEFREVDRLPKQIKFLEITPANPGKFGSPTEGVAAADATPQETSVPYGKDSGAPELMVIHTPSKKEPPRFPRKRKHLFDDTVVLPNKVMRQSLHDSSDLVAKRTSSPVTSLDIWKAYKLPKLYQDFLEPLIPCAPQIETLFNKRFMQSPQTLTSLTKNRSRTRKRPAAERAQPLEPPEGASKSGEAGCEPRRELSQERAHSVESPEKGRRETHREASEERDYCIDTPGSPSRSKDSRQEKDRELTLETVDTRDPSEGPDRSIEPRYDAQSQERAYTSEGPVDIPIPTTSNVDMSVVPMTSLPRKGDDIEMNLLDEDLHHGDVSISSENQNGWSARTSTVARFLSKHFLKQKKCNEAAEVLNMNPIMEGKTRKENARIFYEILVLKSGGFVDLKQDEFYGDISLVTTPQLMATG